jgi:hypothetical protein
MLLFMALDSCLSVLNSVIPNTSGLPPIEPVGLLFSALSILSIFFLGWLINSIFPEFVTNQVKAINSGAYKLRKDNFVKLVANFFKGDSHRSHVRDKTDAHYN